MEGNKQEAAVVRPGARAVEACNVAASEVDAGVGVVNKERWEELGRLRAAGQSVSEIARATGLDRKTVRSCLKKAQWQPYRRAAAAQTLLSAHQAWLLERAAAGALLGPDSVQGAARQPGTGRTRRLDKLRYRGDSVENRVTALFIPCAAELRLSRPSAYPDSPPTAASSSVARAGEPSDCMPARSGRAPHGQAGVRCSQGGRPTPHRGLCAPSRGSHAHSSRLSRSPCGAWQPGWRYRS
jgi:hypothetical protein